MRVLNKKLCGCGTMRAWVVGMLGAHSTSTTAAGIGQCVASGLAYGSTARVRSSSAHAGVPVPGSGCGYLPVPGERPPERPLPSPGVLGRGGGGGGGGRLHRRRRYVLPQHSRPHPCARCLALPGLLCYSPMAHSRPVAALLPVPLPCAPHLHQSHTALLTPVPPPSPPSPPPFPCPQPSP